MNIPYFLKSTQEMLFQAFPKGVSEEYYWILIYLLYDYLADENLALVMSSVTGKPIEIISNDIYKVNQVALDNKTIQEVEFQLDLYGFEEWKKNE